MKFKLNLILLMMLMLISIAGHAALFSTIKNQTDLQQQLQVAKAAHKPVIIEFFASWCSYCQALDQDVFSDKTIQQYMQPFERLRVDLTNRDDNSEQIADFYQVYYTPTLIFYDKNGKQFNTDELNDGVTKESLTKVLEKLS